MDRADEPLEVVVAYGPAPGVADVVTLRLALGATIRDAIAASGVLQRHPSIDLATQRVGIWGRIRPLEAILRDRDRVEIYRTLRVDPKQARRERATPRRPTCSRR